MYGNPYYYKPPDAFQEGMRNAQMVGGLMKNYEDLKEQPDSFKQKQLMGSQQLQGMQIANQMNKMRLGQEPQDFSAKLALMQAQAPNLEANTAYTKERTALAPQMEDLAKQRLALQQQQLGNVTKRFGPAYQVNMALHNPAIASFLANNPQYAKNVLMANSALAGAAATGQSQPVIDNYQQQLQNAHQQILQGMAQQGVPKEQLQQEAASNPQSQNATISSSPVTGAPSNFGYQPFPNSMQPTDQQVQEAMGATRAKLQKDIAPEKLQKGALDYQSLSNNLNNLDITPMMKYAGFKGQAQLPVEKFMMGMGLSKYAPDLGLHSAQDLRDYETTKTALAGILGEKTRQALQASVNPNFYKEVILPLSNPADKGWADPQLMAQKYSMFKNYMQHQAEMYTRAVNQGVGTNIGGDYSSVTPVENIAAPNMAITHGLTTQLKPSDSLHSRTIMSAPDSSNIPHFTPEQKTAYLQQHPGMTLGELNELLSRKGHR
jgi:hypothetical protein